MKRNWIQALTLVLCAVLLAVTLWQGREIEGLRQEIWNVQSSVSNDVGFVKQQVAALSSQIAEGERLVRDWELTPTGMDKGTNSLLTEFSLNLKEWRTDTEVWLTAHQGSGTRIVTLGDNGTGRFSGALPISLAGAALSLEVRVDSSGTSRQEELGGWDDVSMLLPLQMSGSFYSGPTYQDGVFSLGEYSLKLSDRNNVPAVVEEAVFFLRRNGETVWKEVPQEGVCSTGGPVEIECQPGDTVALFFTCRDEYGLKYTFSLQSWEITGDGEKGDIRHTVPEASPVLSWD